MESKYLVTNWEKVAIGLVQYKRIKHNLKIVNASTDRNFQKRFNHFYRMRQRTPQFYEAFYAKLQASKDDSNLTFEHYYEKENVSNI